MFQRLSPSFKKMRSSISRLWPSPTIGIIKVASVVICSTWNFPTASFKNQTIGKWRRWWCKGWNYLHFDEVEASWNVAASRAVHQSLLASRAVLNRVRVVSIGEADRALDLSQHRAERSSLEVLDGVVVVDQRRLAVVLAVHAVLKRKRWWCGPENFLLRNSPKSSIPTASGWSFSTSFRAAVDGSPCCPTCWPPASSSWTCRWTRSSKFFSAVSRWKAESTLGAAWTLCIPAAWRVHPAGPSAPSFRRVAAARCPSPAFWFAARRCLRKKKKRFWGSGRSMCGGFVTFKFLPGLCRAVGWVGLSRAVHRVALWWSFGRRPVVGGDLRALPLDQSRQAGFLAQLPHLLLRWIEERMVRVCDGDGRVGMVADGRNHRASHLRWAAARFIRQYRRLLVFEAPDGW